MFGLRSKTDTAPAPAGPLDRLERRTPAIGRDGAAAPADRAERLRAAAETLPSAISSKLRELIQGGAPAGAPP